MTDRTQQIAALHAEYVRLTGFAIRLDMHREQTWYWWVKKEFTLDDLRTVVRYLQGQIRQLRRNQGALKFTNLIGQPDLFEEDLAMARAEKRNRLPAATDRTSVLHATGRPPTVQSQPASGATPVGAVVHKLTRDPAAAAKALAEFQSLKNRL